MLLNHQGSLLATIGYYRQSNKQTMEDKTVKKQIGLEVKKRVDVLMDHPARLSRPPNLPILPPTMYLARLCTNHCSEIRK